MQPETRNGPGARTPGPQVLGVFHVYHVQRETVNRTTAPPFSRAMRATTAERLPRDTPGGDDGAMLHRHRSRVNSCGQAILRSCVYVAVAGAITLTVVARRDITS